MLYLAGASLLFPTVLYLLLGRGRGRAWGLEPDGAITRGEGAYRHAEERVWKRGRAPSAVRLAAVTSFFMGQMVVPGALITLVLFGFLVSGFSGSDPTVVVLLLSAPTALVTAGKVLAAGTALLARDPGAAVRARRASTWVLAHHFVMLVAAGACIVTKATDEPNGWLLVLGYGAVAAGQSLLLRRGAAALDAYDAAQGRDPAPAGAAAPPR